MNKLFICIISFVLVSICSAQTDQLPTPKAGEVVMKFWITDWEEIPESDARIEVQNTSLTYDAKGTSDIDGHFNLLAPSGDTYNISIYKFDTVFHFNGIEAPKEDVGYEFDMQLKIKVVTEEYISISNLAVHFESNQYVLDQSDKNALQALVDQMKSNENMKVEIAAHTDNVGDDKSNMRLSQQRANSVRNYLKTNGVTDTHLISKGYGEQKPVATNDTTEGRALNRRVECRIIEQ